MTPAQVLEAVQTAGGSLDFDGQQVHLRAPKGAISASLRTALTAQRDGIVQLLRPADPVNENETPVGDVLATWLYEPMPVHTWVPGDATVLGFVDVQDRLAAHLQRGRSVLAAASPAHPRLGEAGLVLANGEATLAALSQLILALSECPYDRALLARWCAGQAFLQGDPAAALAFVDAAGGAAGKE